MQRNNSPKGGGKHRHGPRENCSESETDYFYLRVLCIYVSLSEKHRHMSYGFSKSLKFDVMGRILYREALSLFSDRTLDG